MKETKSLAIQLTKMKVEREQDGKHAREEERVESVLAGKQVGTKPQVLNPQNKAPAGSCAPCAHGECEHRAPKPSRDTVNTLMKRMHSATTTGGEVLGCMRRRLLARPCSCTNTST